MLVTDAEYRKADVSFQSAPGLECLRAPDAEADLASAVREAHAAHVIVGARIYSGALYDALPAGGVIARFGVGHDGIDKARATAAGLLCTNTPGVLNQSVSILSGAMSFRTTLAPARASRRAIPAPIPCPEPVTTATRSTTFMTLPLSTSLELRLALLDEGLHTLNAVLAGS